MAWFAENRDCDPPKAKAEPDWRFWGLFVHVTKKDTLREAYRLAKANNGAPGIDGVTFAAIEGGGVERFLDGIRDDLVSGKYRPMRNRQREIPKNGGKGVRVLSIPTIRDRVVQGALKLILEPIFEADFQSGSYGYRPKRSAHQAVERVATEIVRGKTQVIDLDLRAYFDNIRHHIVLEKVAKRVKDDAILRLLKLILKAAGKRGVPQGEIDAPWGEPTSLAVHSPFSITPAFSHFRMSRSTRLSAIRCSRNFISQSWLMGSK